MNSLQQTEPNKQPIQPILNPESLPSDFLRSDQKSFDCNNLRNVDLLHQIDPAIIEPAKPPCLGIYPTLVSARGESRFDQVENRLPRNVRRRLRRRERPELDPPDTTTQDVHDLNWSNRFAMQREAAYLLHMPTGIKTRGSRAGDPKYEKITRCCRFALGHTAHVGISLNPDSGTTSFGQLERCELIACPVCGVRRGERSRLELVAATSEASKQNMIMALVTFTARHDRTMPLDELTGKVQEAFTGLWRGRAGVNLRAKYQIVGMVRVVEATRGAHGWHPHIHVLMFFESVGEDREATGWTDYLRAELSGLWIKQLAKHKLTASDDRGVDVRAEDQFVAEYVAKFGKEPIDRVWSAADEVGRAGAKQARKDSLTPFQLLSVATGINSEAAEMLVRNEKGLKRAKPGEVRSYAGDLWLEYYFAIKGTHLLQWSKGLRARLNVDQAVEALEAAQAAETAQPVERVLIPVDQWNEHIAPHDNRFFVYKDLRAEVLAVCRKDRETIRAWFEAHGIAAIILEDPPGAAPPNVTDPLGEPLRNAQPPLFDLQPDRAGDPVGYWTV